MRTAPFLALAALAGCVRITDEEYDQRIDRDGDGYVSTQFGGDDCDDRSASVHPGAAEACDGIDADCDGDLSDGEDATAWYPDADGDGYGALGASPTLACEAPSGSVEDHTDCDDGDAAIHPGATEVCNDGVAIDEDCDPQTLAPPSTWYLDDDGDDYGAAASAVEACERPEDHILVGEDCDDTDAAVNPGAAEVCNNTIDDDCDGAAEPCTWAGERASAEAGGAFFSSQTGARMGAALAAADLDGDGQVELLSTAQLPGATRGTLYLLPPDPSVGEADLEDHVLARIEGDGTLAFGAALSAGPLEEGDLPAVAVGAPDRETANGATGAVFLYPTLPVADALAEGVAGMVELEGRRAGDRLGAAVALIPDIDGDDVADLLVGAPDALVEFSGTSLPDAGALFIVSTGTLSASNGRLEERVADGDAVWWAGTRSDSPFSPDTLGPEGHLGSVVAYLGDPVGDGTVAVAGGSGTARLSTASCDGAVAVLDAEQAGDGSFRTLVDAGALALLCDPSGGTEFGAALAGNVDLDGDGLDDIVVGAPGAAEGGGKAHVLLSSVGNWTGAVAPIDTLDGDVVSIFGQGSDQAGAAVALSPDLTGDGLPDVVVGAPGANDTRGAVWVFSGLSTAVSLTAADADAVLVGDETDAALGGALLAPGDVTGDLAGQADLLVGAPDRSNGGRAGGEVWLIPGLSL